MVVSLYWISTALISVYLVLSAYTYIWSESTISGVRELGFPDFFRIQLAILKGLAAILLIIPGVPAVVREWAYAGVGFFIITAFIAHMAHKDPIWINAINVALFILLVLSYVFSSK